MGQLMRSLRASIGINKFVYWSVFNESLVSTECHSKRKKKRSCGEGSINIRQSRYHSWSKEDKIKFGKGQ